MNFDHILNWKLLSGSHEFPGPDGGTCINEAAIIAAGFEYKKVSSASDCPPCFSRPISSYAIYLNDKMPDALRQKLLMPFVMRLAGSADTPDIERQRAEYLLVGFIREILSIPLRGWKEDIADQFAAVQTLEQAHEAIRAFALAFDRAGTGALARALAFDRSLDSARARAFALDIDRALDSALDIDQEIFEAAVLLLDGALKIGKQAEPLEMACVADRMVKAKSDALETV